MSLFWWIVIGIIAIISLIIYVAKREWKKGFEICFRCGKKTLRTWIEPFTNEARCYNPLCQAHSTNSYNDDPYSAPRGPFSLSMLSGNLRLLFEAWTLHNKAAQKELSKREKGELYPVKHAPKCPDCKISLMWHGFSGLFGDQYERMECPNCGIDHLKKRRPKLFDNLIYEIGGMK